MYKYLFIVLIFYTNILFSYEKAMQRLLSNPPIGLKRPFDNEERGFDTPKNWQNSVP
jgi:hypothetical protein